jgi:hypothetical protein
MLQQCTWASPLSGLDGSALHILYEATVWVPDFVLTEWIITLCPTALSATTVETPGFIAITCNNNMKDK